MIIIVIIIILNHNKLIHFYHLILKVERISKGGDECECRIYCVFHWAVFMVHDKSGQEGERRRKGGV